MTPGARTRCFSECFESGSQLADLECGGQVLQQDAQGTVSQAPDAAGLECQLAAQNGSVLHLADQQQAASTTIFQALSGGPLGLVWYPNH